MDVEKSKYHIIIKRESSSSIQGSLGCSKITNLQKKYFPLENGLAEISPYSDRFSIRLVTHREF